MIVPLVCIESSQLGGIILSDGDTISIHASDDFSEMSSSQGTRVVVSGISPSAGQSIQMPGYSRLTQLHQQHAGPYADIAILTRVTPTGRLRHHMIPLDAHGAVGTDIDLNDGDLVHFANMDLLPILIQSRATSRKLQLKAIEDEERLGVLRKPTKERHHHEALRAMLTANRP